MTADGPASQALDAKAERHDENVYAFRWESLPKLAAHEPQVVLSPSTECRRFASCCNKHGFADHVQNI